MNIVTRKQALATKIPLYFTGKACLYGHVASRYTSTGNCLECMAAYCAEKYLENRYLVKQRSKNWKADNPARVKELVKKDHEVNRDKYKRRSISWALAHPEQNKKNKRDWNEKNKERKSLLGVNWRRNNKRTIVFYAANRRAQLINATPMWADLGQIKIIYESCPEGFHVDHIVPIKGITPDGCLVSGLHVPLNLRHLGAFENISRRNRISAQDLNLIEAMRFI